MIGFKCVCFREGEHWRRHREGWTKEETINSLIRKAGFRGSITENLRLSLRTTRYQSTAAKATYEEYLRARRP